MFFRTRSYINRLENIMDILGSLFNISNLSRNPVCADPGVELLSFTASYGPNQYQFTEIPFVSGLSELEVLAVLSDM